MPSRGWAAGSEVLADGKDDDDDASHGLFKGAVRLRTEK